MKVIPIQQAASAIVTPDTALSPAPGEALFDRRGLSVRDLRISVTDRCNFRCVYCMTREVFGDDYAFLPRRELLSFEEITRVADHVIYVPPVRDALSPITATVPLQLLAREVAVLRGCDVDQPRNLAKSVTVE